MRTMTLLPPAACADIHWELSLGVTTSRADELGAQHLDAHGHLTVTECQVNRTKIIGED